MWINGGQRKCKIWFCVALNQGTGHSKQDFSASCLSSQVQLYRGNKSTRVLSRESSGYHKGLFPKLRFRTSNRIARFSCRANHRMLQLSQHCTITLRIHGVRIQTSCYLTHHPHFLKAGGGGPGSLSRAAARFQKMVILVMSVRVTQQYINWTNPF